MSRDLALIDEARKALAEAKTIGETSEIRDQAAAMERYLKRREGAEEAGRYATEIRLRAERKIGELLDPTKEKRGGAKSRRASLPKGLTHSVSNTSNDAFLACAEPQLAVRSDLESGVSGRLPRTIGVSPHA